jgi:hypothetical protein
MLTMSAERVRQSNDQGLTVMLNYGKIALFHNHANPRGGINIFLAQLPAESQHKCGTVESHPGSEEITHAPLSL